MTTTTKQHQTGRELGIVFLYLGLGLCSGAIWMNIANLQALPSWHFEMITGRAPAPNQYRPLTPWLAELLRNLLPGQNLFYSYMLLRGLVTGLTLWLFDRYLRTWFNRSAAAGGALALAAIIPFTYYRVVQESDPLNLLVITTAFFLLARGRDLLLIPLVVLGTLNRETAAMIPAVYLLARWRERPLTEVLPRTAMLALCWIVVYAGLLGGYGRREYYCDPIMLSRNLASAFPTLQVALVFGALWALAVLGAKRTPTLLRRGLWVVAPYLALHYVVAMVNEVRLFLPLAPLVIPLSWWYLFPEALTVQPVTKRKG